MAENYISDSMLDMFLYETGQMIESLENIALEKQNDDGFDEASVNEIFRIMHTIKGSSGVMMYQNITMISHKLEDVFYYLRESKPTNVPHSELIGYMMDVASFITEECDKIKDGREPDGDCTELHGKIDEFLSMIKNDIKKSGSELPAENKYVEPTQFYIAPATNVSSHHFHIVVHYESGTEMANIRAYTMAFNLKDIAEDMYYLPEDIVSNPDTAKDILDDGFKVAIQTMSSEKEVLEIINRCVGIEKIDIKEVDESDFANLAGVKEEKTTLQYGGLVIDLDGPIPDSNNETAKAPEKEALTVQKTQPVNPLGDEKLEGKATDKLAELADKGKEKKAAEKPKGEKREVQRYISVNVNKMDELMDMIGELVISQAFVLQNPDLKIPGLDLTNFNKAAGQMSKITSDLQEIIMSMRMMPLANTFQKMNKIVFDVSRKLGKDIDLKIIGEETEMDKNIIEHISDPLMHLIRNAVDHGIESKADRLRAGKPEKGLIRLEAKNEGGKVWIIVKDDGAGMVKEKLIAKAKKQGLLNNRNEKDMTDKEIFNLVTLPGFSTNETVTEYSGRGVGMDVVVQNLTSVGGSLDIESEEGKGTTFTMKIPLTLAIVDGIVVSVGESKFVAATGNIQEFICVTNDMVIKEPDGGQGIMIRGECYPLIRLKEYFKLKDGIDDIEKGVLMIVEHEGRKAGLFIDKIYGEQEIVVKPLPPYINKVKGVSSCTQLGDGSISLIIDIAGIMKGA
ncbi:MAG: chemotaxis protein CheA [Lachnospiraceae bacterium]|nr:chemotaxis protein CheA [Lachnospiraceae bacterium]